MYKFLNKYITFLIDIFVINIGIFVLIGSYVSNKYLGLGSGIVLLITGIIMLVVDIRINKTI
jgi:hypothetical protein